MENNTNEQQPITPAIAETPVPPQAETVDVLQKLKALSEGKKIETANTEEEIIADEKNALEELKRADAEKKAEAARIENEEIERKKQDLADLKVKKELLLAEVDGLEDQYKSINKLHEDFRGSIRALRERYKTLKKDNSELFEQNEIDSLDKFIDIFREDTANGVAPLLEAKQQAADAVREELPVARDLKTGLTQELGMGDKSSHSEILNQVEENNAAIDASIEEVRKEIPEEVEKMHQEHREKIASVLETSFDKNPESKKILSDAISEIVALSDSEKMRALTPALVEKVKSAFLKSNYTGVVFDDISKYGPEVFKGAIEDFIVKKVDNTLQEQLIADEEDLVALDEFSKYKKEVSSVCNEVDGLYMSLSREDRDFLDEHFKSSDRNGIVPSHFDELFPKIFHTTDSQRGTESVVKYLRKINSSDEEALNVLRSELGQKDSVLINGELIKSVDRDIVRYTNDILIPAIKSRDTKFFSTVRHYGDGYGVDGDYQKIINKADYPTIGVDTGDYNTPHIDVLRESVGDSYQIPSKTFMRMREMVKNEKYKKLAFNNNEVLNYAASDLRSAIRSRENTARSIGEQTGKKTSLQIASQIIQDNPEYRAAISEKQQIENVNLYRNKCTQELNNYLLTLSGDASIDKNLPLSFTKDGFASIEDVKIVAEKDKIEEYLKEGSPMNLEKSQLKSLQIELSALREKKASLLGRFSVSDADLEKLEKRIQESGQEIKKFEFELSNSQNRRNTRERNIGKVQELAGSLYQALKRSGYSFESNESPTNLSQLMEIARRQNVSIPENVTNILDIAKQLTPLR